MRAKEVLPNLRIRQDVVRITRVHDLAVRHNVAPIRPREAQPRVLLDDQDGYPLLPQGVNPLDNLLLVQW